VYRAGGDRLELQTGGTVLGFLESATFEEETVRLHPGDRVLLYTDGITEAVNPAGEMFGEDRLDQTMTGIPREVSARATIEALLERVRAFTGDVEPADDMTVMVLRVLDAPGPSRA
jgi:sigma-B regulation protein RsbU (phosphoserine phosphatase)